MLANYVTLDQGSGIVHTAPGHGADDFITGQKYNLEIYAPLDDRGVYQEGLPEYKGQRRVFGEPDHCEACWANVERCWPITLTSTAIRIAGVATIR